MKNKFINVTTKVKTRIKKMSPGLMNAAVIGAAILSQTAFAADTTIFTVIVKAIGGGCIVGAAVTAIMGIVSYADAQAEGEGPAMSKAKNQLKGAAFLAVVGVALAAGASTIAGTIKDITF